MDWPGCCCLSIARLAMHDPLTEGSTHLPARQDCPGKDGQPAPVAQGHVPRRAPLHAARRQREAPVLLARTHLHSTASHAKRTLAPLSHVLQAANDLLAGLQALPCALQPCRSTAECTSWLKHSHDNVRRKHSLGAKLALLKHGEWPRHIGKLSELDPAHRDATLVCSKARQVAFAKEGDLTHGCGELHSRQSLCLSCPSTTDCLYP